MGPSGTKKLIAVGISGAVALSLLFVAAWMVFAGGAAEPEPDGVRIIAPAETSEPSTVGSPGAAASALTPSPTVLPEEIAVYITGEVVNPGVYTVAKGERLDAALRLAGGATENADLSRVNLAAYATDAAHYNIPTAGEPVGPGEPLHDGSAPNADEVGVSESCQPPVNINTANAACLETLPGIGGVRAASIVAHREQQGPFASPDAITEVSGIGDGIFRRIAELITVDPH
ncbi:MAG: ComEA family DNA-binding protein [Chloroflexota bacterium]|nr:ComEA family DNA-binding protein [Chloroflexota bacterium]MDE2960731.1 ComEA family DNA-binding protein [Chloroflexota bacterium]